MDAHDLQKLKQHLEFDVWHNRNTLDENLFVWQETLSDDLLPGWQPLRIRTLYPSRPEASVKARAIAGLPSLRQGIIHSIWQARLPAPALASETVMSIEQYACASRAEAHAFVVILMGEFEGPLMARQDQSGIGDIYFCAPEQAAVVFARANQVLWMRNAGRNWVRLDASARQIDQTFIAKVQHSAAEEGAEIPAVRLSPSKQRPEGGIPLQLTGTRTLQPSMIKFFSRSGEIMLADGRLVYQPQAAGRQTLQVCMVHAAGAYRQDRKFTLK